MQICSTRIYLSLANLASTVTIATMLDNAFGIFNNVVPRFQWAEIDLTFPSDDRYFKLTSYDQMLATRQFPQRKVKIKDAFLVLFSPPEVGDKNLTVLRQGYLSALDMQILMHCKQLVHNPCRPPT